MIRSKRIERTLTRLRDRIRRGPEILDPSFQTSTEFRASLHAQLARDGVRSHLLGEAWWDDFYHAITSHDQDGVEIQKRMIQHAEALPESRLRAEELLVVFRFLLRFGLFRVGYAVRAKARWAAIHAFSESPPADDPKAGLLALSALLELRQWETFEAKLPLLDQRFDREKGSLLILYRLLTDGAVATRAHDALIRTEEDLAYSKYISTKRVALVGPARTESRDATEVDGFDRVIRCNYKEDGVGTDPEVKGLRCDVSYYNSAQAKFVFKHIPQDTFPRGMDWLVCKHRSRSVKLRAWIESFPAHAGGRVASPHARVRSSGTFELPLFAGTLNALPNAVLDLLGLGVGEIKIFHSDLMLTVERAEGYDPLVRNAEDALFMAVQNFPSPHDPITQYALLQTLYDAGAISGDARFSAAMSLGESAYMDEIQKAYGSAARPYLSRRT